MLDFLADRRPEGPCLVVDLDVVRDNAQSAPTPSVRMRQKTRVPGAARATFSTTSKESTA
jgi:hypothetical protein